PPTPRIYPLSLHDALPILAAAPQRSAPLHGPAVRAVGFAGSFDEARRRIFEHSFRAALTSPLPKRSGFESVRRPWAVRIQARRLDRKSTRLNSSHVAISYA